MTTKEQLLLLADEIRAERTAIEGLVAHVNFMAGKLENRLSRLATLAETARSLSETMPEPSEAEPKGSTPTDPFAPNPGPSPQPERPSSPAPADSIVGLLSGFRRFSATREAPRDE